MNVYECWEHMHEAVVELSTGQGAPRQRLLIVADRHLGEVAQLAHKLRDPELRAWIVRIVRKLQGNHNRPSRMAVLAAVNAMSDEAVDDLLIDIVSFYDELTREEMMRRVAVTHATGEGGLGQPARRL